MDSRRTAECPVCCRQVEFDLINMHIDICMNRSGDCDVGVIQTRPQTANTGGATAHHFPADVQPRPTTPSANSTLTRTLSSAHQTNIGQYYKHYNDNYYTANDTTATNTVNNVSQSNPSGADSHASASTPSTNNNTTASLDRNKYEVNVVFESESPMRLGTSASPTNGHIQLEPTGSPVGNVQQNNTGYSIENEAEEKRQPLPVSDEKVKRLLALFPPGSGLPTHTSREVLIREALAAAGDDADIAAVILLEAGSGGWVAPPRDNRYSAADSIETPRGSSSFDSGSGSETIGRRGVLSPSRVVYASRPPSERSNSRPRTFTTASGVPVGKPRCSIDSKAPTPAEIDDELAEVIGISTSNQTSSSNTLPHKLSGGRRPSVAVPITSNASSNSANHHHSPRATSKVELIIYDLKPDMSVAKKLGFGVYHSGVVVYGSEIAFGGSANLAKDSGRSGIWAAKPGHAGVKISERIIIGETHWSAADIRGFIKEWGSKEFIVDAYHLLSFNCNHFSEKFLAKLAERGKLVPESHYFLSHYGSGGFATAIAHAQKRHQRVSSHGSTTPPPTNISDTTSERGGVSPPRAPLFTTPVIADPSLIDEVCSNPSAIKSAFQLPTYVNRVASVGHKVVPDFIFKALMQKVNPPPAPTNEKGAKYDTKNQSKSNVTTQDSQRSVSASAATAVGEAQEPSHNTYRGDPLRRTTSLGLQTPKSVSRREYDSVCFIAAALGLVLSSSALAMEEAISSSPSKEDLIIAVPQDVIADDGVFTQCLRALRLHDGDTSSALEELLTNS